jgi:CRISPR-associated protein Cmr6
MTPPNPLERPKRPQKTVPAVQRPNAPAPRSDRPVPRGGDGGPRPNQPNNRGGGGGNRGGGSRGGGRGGGGNREEIPSPWLLEDRQPTPDGTASFIEYLRWMRSPDHTHKDPTKVQILQMAEENARHYNARLETLNQRTKLIAGQDNCFQVKSSWRIRVGGHRGPESILLPAFDALGMPYLPSATLRGVARTRAIREFMAQDNLNWKEAEKKIAPYFGSLDAEKGDRMGKVIFLDAYPMPGKVGLTVDMANNVWSWGDNDLNYSPNPNPFLSLKEPTFLIGLKLASGCKDAAILKKVKQWLIEGLKWGAGSQINSGYGELLAAGSGVPENGFFRLEFSLEGQLIHGRQKFTQWNWNDRRQEWQMRGQPDAEVRAIAFKSILRYWFRVLTRGVLELDQIQEWEGNLFGSISPNQQLGLVKFNIRDGELIQEEPRPYREGKNDACGKQAGTLILTYGPEVEDNQKQHLLNLFKNLTWLAFHLGGVGLGARRPCYSRSGEQRAPWYRGSTLIPENEDTFWGLPETPAEFQRLFRERLGNFYRALSQLSGHNIDERNPRNIGRVSDRNWSEALDGNCRIVVVSGDSENFNKPYALDLLHRQFHQLENNREYQTAKNLCGGVQRGATPSPIWIADMGDYEVVTVFGATQNPRREYLNSLRQNAADFCPIWPL